jgi:hypothetical protein
MQIKECVQQLDDQFNELRNICRSKAEAPAETVYPFFLKISTIWRSFEDICLTGHIVAEIFRGIKYFVATNENTKTSDPPRASTATSKPASPISENTINRGAMSEISMNF